MLVLWLAFVFCALLWRWCQPSRSKLEPPKSPGALPLLGHLNLIIGDSAIIAEPDDALTVANACLGKHSMYDFAKPWLGNGLITAPVSVWQQHRKLLNPTFKQLMLYGYMDVFNRQARRLVGKVSDQAGRGPFDYIPFVHQNALETICKTTMNFDFADNTVINSEYMEAVDKIAVLMFRRVQEPWLYFDITFKWSGLKKVLQKKRLELKQKSLDRMSEENEDEHLSEKAKTFLELLMAMSEKHGHFTDEEVRKHVDTIIVSGYDTVATALFFTTILIGSYPRVQQRLLEELQNVFGESDRDVTKDDLSRLVYLEAIIKESLRIYTVAPAFARNIDKDIKIKNFTLRAGKSCIVSLYGIHRHRMWGEDADEFRPERWLDPSTLPANANAFVAFSLGRRQCIGKTYAMMSLKTSLAHFLRRYKVTADHSKMVLKMDILLKPLSGHQICVDQRTL
ncbi:unnamed protein product, partial [Iphiclides podalirius]